MLVWDTLILIEPSHPPLMFLSLTSRMVCPVFILLPINDFTKQRIELSLPFQAFFYNIYKVISCFLNLSYYSINCFSHWLQKSTMDVTTVSY